MAKKMILMLLVMAVFIAAIGAFKYRQIKGGAAAQAAFQPPPETVTTVVARQEEWPATLNAIGTVAAVQGVTVSADSARHRRRDRASSPAGRCARATCSSSSTPAGARPSSPPPSRSATSPASTSSA